MFRLGVEGSQEALVTALAAAVPELGGPPEIVGLERQRGNGFSSETWFCTVRSAAGRNERLVLRLAPEGEGVFPSYDLGQQHRILRALRQEDYPVPRAWLHQPASPSAFPRDVLVMERVGGRSARDAPVYTSTGWLLELEPSAQRAAYLATLELLARLHRVDWQRHDLADLRRLDGRDPHGGSELDYYRRYAEWVAPRTHADVLHRAEAWLLDHVPVGGEPVLSWGDAKVSNVLYDEHAAPVSVLDWEMAFVGPPEADLGFWLVYDRWASEGLGFPRLPGFPDPAETLGRYEELSGRRLQGIHWFEVWAAYRLALLQFRLDYLLRRHRERRPGGRPIYLPAVQIIDDLLRGER